MANNTGPQAEMIRLIELEYERTAHFMTGVTGTSSSIRGWAITIWLAVLGIALERGSPHLVVVASLAAFAFLILDAYHAHLYGQSLDHARQLELISARYYESLGRGDIDPDIVIDLETDLQSHRFGLYRRLRPVRWRTAHELRPTLFFRLLYPILIAVPIAIAALVPLNPDAGACQLVADNGAVHADCGADWIPLVISSPAP